MSYLPLTRKSHTGPNLTPVLKNRIKAYSRRAKVKAGRTSVLLHAAKQQLTLLVHVELRESADSQEVSRRCTRGESEESVRSLQVKKHASEEIHPVFEIQGRHHQKYKIEVSVASEKGLMSSIFFLKKNEPTSERVFPSVSFLARCE